MERQSSVYGSIFAVQKFDQAFRYNYEVGKKDKDLITSQECKQHVNKSRVRDVGKGNSQKQDGFFNKLQERI